jgi:hypothetical protein
MSAQEENDWEDLGNNPITFSKTTILPPDQFVSPDSDSVINVVDHGSSTDEEEEVFKQWIDTQEEIVYVPDIKGAEPVAVKVDIDQSRNTTCAAAFIQFGDIRDEGHVPYTPSKEFPVNPRPADMQSQNGHRLIDHVKFGRNNNLVNLLKTASTSSVPTTHGSSNNPNPQVNITFNNSGDVTVSMAALRDYMVESMEFHNTGDVTIY